MASDRPHRLLRLVGRLVTEEDGPTAAEYAIMLALIVLVSVATINAIGQKFYNLYAIIASGLPEAAA